MADTDLASTPTAREGAAGPAPAPATAPAGRIDWVDYARGVAIVLVVVGHVLGGLVPALAPGPTRDAFFFAGTWIYGFHMPTFFMAAGLFAPASLRKGTRAFFVDKAATVVYPYVVWGVGQTLLQIAVAPYVNNPADWHDLVRLLYAPPMQFWFLYVLAVAFVAYAACRAIGVGAAGLFALCLAVGALARWAGLPVTSVPGRFGDQVPFFAAGIILRHHAARVGGAPTPALLAVAAAGAAISVGLLLAAPIPPYPASLLIALPGVAMLVAISALLARLGGPSVLARLGRWSLEIYLVHVLAYAGARIALRKGLGVTDAYVHLVVGTAAGLAIPVALAVLAERASFPYLFRWPIRRPEAPPRPGATTA